ncbi:MtnX-like HAD-IB family phosphatase [Haliovirga abyssi]|uniref:2,3-diketo-5-methylthio-1-phosphopentane phosphatase n=1 Tax=Haliovirga abyssi TaxID=2996794 RepID=A0AAU9DLS8_9FUSO|nr:MtnX-like HAD-IB family phosphatase [Haliovirga abyssi]BDU50922.1 2,3-diketo-5-methylthio-1-phosphopentane phosphatase [Haliovirga abyssi]
MKNRKDMINKKNKEDKIMILIDFDKTITNKDSTDELVRIYNEDEVLNTQKSFQNKEINIKEYLSKLLGLLELSEEEFKIDIVKNVEVDRYFVEFLNFVKLKKYEYRIVSAATCENIDAVLEYNNIFIDKNKIYSNNLIFEDNKLKVEFPYEKNCGFCGICKKSILGKYKDMKYKIIYIGDGSSDICASGYADILFAKKGYGLEKYCIAENIDYYGYKNFRNIIEKLEESII